MNEYNLKRFKGMGTRSGDYFISFNKSGFQTSADFYAKEKIKNHKKVILYFDKSKKAVGFQFTNDDKTEGAFTLVHGNKQSAASFTVNSFIKANNLTDPKYYGRRKPIKIKLKGIGEVFVIELVKKENMVENTNEHGQNI